MNFEDRKKLLKKVEDLRGRKVVCLFNFDRASQPPIAELGLAIQFDADTKEALFRVLKESKSNKIDICLYTRGGDVNSVWSLVSIVREFDADFEVLVPFRCHSSGTLFALGAKKIVLTPLAELSPIDPTTGNQFNPISPVDGASGAPQRLGIGVEDVRAYRSFVLDQLAIDPQKEPEAVRVHLAPFLAKLAQDVHPLALGNVERVSQQIKQLAGNLLALHPTASRKNDEVVEALTKRFWSHVHMINRTEAKEILGGDHVEFAPPDLSIALDELLRAYEDQFNLRKAFFLGSFLADDRLKDARFMGGVLESIDYGYIHETKVKIQQQSILPPNVQVQLPMGQEMPLVPGLPRATHVDIVSRGWIHNTEPKGFDK